MVHAYGATTRFQFSKRYISGSAAKLVTTNTDQAGEKKKIKRKKKDNGRKPGSLWVADGQNTSRGRTAEAKKYNQTLRREKTPGQCRCENTEHLHAV